MISVGVRTPLGGCVLTGTGPWAAREAPFCVRPVPARPIGPVALPKSDMGAFTSSQSGVNGRGFRIASSSAQRIADAVRGETLVDLRGQYDSPNIRGRSSVSESASSSSSVWASESAGRSAATPPLRSDTGWTSTGIVCSIWDGRPEAYTDPGR